MDSFFFMIGLGFLAMLIFYKGSHGEDVQKTKTYMGVAFFICMTLGSVAHEWSHPDYGTDAGNRHSRYGF